MDNVHFALDNCDLSLCNFITNGINGSVHCMRMRMCLQCVIVYVRVSCVYRVRFSSFRIRYVYTKRMVGSQFICAHANNVALKKCAQTMSCQQKYGIQNSPKKIIISFSFRIFMNSTLNFSFSNEINVVRVFIGGKRSVLTLAPIENHIITYFVCRQCSDSRNEIFNFGLSFRQRRRRLTCMWRVNPATAFHRSMQSQVKRQSPSKQEYELKTMTI